MGRRLCSSCNGTGSRVSTQTIVNTTQIGPTHQTVTQTVPCGSCGGSGGFWVPDPQPPVPKGPAKASGRARPRTHAAVAGPGSGSHASDPSASEGDGARKLFSIIGFFAVLIWVFGASPDPNPLFALVVATVGGILVGRFWKALVIIAILALIVSNAGS